MISSLQNQMIKDLMRLHQSKYRKQASLFLVEGPHLVEEAHQAGWLQSVLSTEDTSYPNTILVASHIIEKLSTTDTPQHIIGVCRPQDVKATGKHILVLYPSDPGNIGALLRSALAFGIDRVAVASGVDVFNPKVIRASAGAIFHIEFLGGDVRTISKRNPDHHVIKATLKGTIAKPMNDPFILVIGHESAGITFDVPGIDMTIPTTGVESLNAAVAGSILMYQLTR